MIRITADLDFKNPFKIGYYLMKSFIIIKRIQHLTLRPSYSKGYHLEIWSSYPYTIKEHFNLRAKIGDDPSRIRLDKIRKIGRNTLFYNKIMINKSKKTP